MTTPPKLSSEESIYDSKYALNIEFLDAGLKAIKLKQIKQLGTNFRDNLDLVQSMTALPLLLLTLEHYRHGLIPYEIQAAIKSKLQRIELSEARKEVFESEVLPKKSAQIDEALDGADKTFSALLQDNSLGLRNTYQALLFSAAVWIWCSFEILMKELWELALNYSGSYLTKNVVTKLSNLENRGSIDLLRGRYISLEYLAKQGYNISDKLGTVLSYKFDFTSVNGVKEAYSAAFPKSTTIRDALENEGINALEATRHVVVHNAGIADENFCKKFNLSKSEIGERLQIDTRRLNDYANSSIEVALIIMTAVSSILADAKRPKQK